MIRARRNRILSFVDRAVARGAAPGVQYVAVGPEGTVVEVAAGLADVAGGRPILPTTTMMAYSMTKVVTAAAVLQLVERRDLSLDASVKGYLPSIPYDAGITLRHLLSQTSGLPDPIPLRWVHLPEEHAAQDERATLAGIVARHPRARFPPGRRYAYSNLSYWLLGQVVEQVTGARFEDHVARIVFGRLSLPADQIGFVIPARDRHAKGYLRWWSAMNLLLPLLVDRRFVGGREGRWRHVKDAYLDGPAYGGIVASARALAGFLHDLIRDDPVLLGEEGRRLFFERQADAAGRPVEMTLGWHVGRGPGEPCLFKEGGGAGFRGEMRVYRQSRTASVAIANSTSFDVRRFLDEVDREVVAGRIPRDEERVGRGPPL
jgi:CubicO group peptidase (beta-lactamase class C family)